VGLLILRKDAVKGSGAYGNHRGGLPLVIKELSNALLEITDREVSWLANIIQLE